jgi:dihydroorotate dehydrogenase
MATAQTKELKPVFIKMGPQIKQKEICNLYLLMKTKKFQSLYHSLPAIISL